MKKDQNKNAKRFAILSEAMNTKIGHVLYRDGILATRHSGNVWETICGMLVDTHSVVEIMLGEDPKVIWPNNVLGDLNPMSPSWSPEDEYDLFNKGE